ncbi:CGI-121-domain-containing protein [Cystobasidium minutum MCA 4210]|uniref:CGI-121-domain-containing protein n=1 Tax=Cystobasidium minutum MCA 4210 TaxID=1397322 RepID=UPI0034CD58F4|eukprot:jgi/Rhomi1/56760/CE56759_108
MESYALPTPAYPAELAEISFALFVNMEGSAALRQRLIKASTMEGDEGITERQRVDFAFLDAKMIASRDQLLPAAHQSILAAAQGELQTQTIHSEIISNLNPTSNVAEGLRRFGISAKSTAAIVRIGPKLSESEKRALQDEMQALAGGELGALDDLAKNADVAGLKKLYKLDNTTDLTPKLLASLTASNKSVGVF